jgi:hypothetical protein
MKKFLVSVPLLVALVFGISIGTHLNAAQVERSPAQPQAQQQAQPGLITGKVTAVSGRSFSIEVGEADAKRTMQFTTDTNTAISGELKVGSTATVQYRAGAGNQNLATKVDIRS